MPTFKVLPKIPFFLRPGNFSQCCVMFIVKNSPGKTRRRVPAHASRHVTKIIIILLLLLLKILYVPRRAFQHTITIYDLK